ncbi:MAG: PAS domain S-box protein [Ardenticatenaceae bacterium]|nr:PAS domain S-box protein [Ardenticatenaceae bacterium]
MNDTTHTDKPNNPQTEETTPAPASSGLTVVGIGASAGGLVALQGFFDALPDDTGMAFVVVTHMDPQRESLLPEILQKHTGMPVNQVQELIRVQADHVYVIPPNQRIVITDTHLDLEQFEEPRGHRLPIDHFFRSLAGVHRDAVAIILSGGGTDGSVGVKAIKEMGGLLMVQHPDEAEHDSMPRAAINTGLADVILPVAQLAEKLVAYRHNGVHLPQDPGVLTTREIELVYRILTQVQARIGHDFSQYKRSTILRRIRRRMQLHGLASLEAYLTFLRHEDGEAQALFNDLLIGVTNFFRDREAWEALEEDVISQLFNNKSKNENVRVWAIGCATGEEAYSLAILLTEYLDKMERPRAARPGIQVFASDLDDIALGKARDGLYPEAIEADVSPERLARFFEKEGSYYRIRRELRDSVLFSNHSVLRDPPFSRLDLISCRNLLIYLQREMQESVFQIFHYALNPEGYLFLGSSETAEMVHELFSTLDKTHRIYRARPWRSEHRAVPTLPLSLPRPSQSLQTPSFHGRRPPGATTQHSGALDTHLKLLEEAAPPSILVNENFQILHTSANAGRYLLHPGGAPTTNLLQLVRPELQFELRASLSQALSENKPIVSRPVAVRFNGAPHSVILGIRPQAAGETTAAGDNDQRLLIVFFFEDETDRPQEQAVLPLLAEGEQDTSRREAIFQQLEEEVLRLRERLQSLSEEYESSTEELKAANEELQSINEEYRSTTEELETSKEELQSVNEELQTVNSELKNKLEEISRAHSDLENLLASTEIATLFLDRDLRIQRYTPGTTELFSIMPGDRGRPLVHLTNKLDYPTLTEDAARVLRRLVPIEREIRDADGRWLLTRLRPYRTIDDRIDGVVITFVDVTQLKEAEQTIRRSEERLQKIIQNTATCVIFIHPSGRVMDANDTFYRLTGYTRQEVETGQLTWQKMTPPKWMDISYKQFENVERNGQLGPYEKEYLRKDGSRLPLIFAGSRLEDGTIVEFGIDVTEQKKVEQDLVAEKEYSQKIVAAVREGLLVLQQDTTIEFANESFFNMFHVNPQETIGRHIYDLGNGQWDIPQLRQLLEDILPQATVFNDYRVEHTFEDIGHRVMLLNARSIPHTGRVLLVIEDITDRERYENELKELNANLENRVNQRTEQVRQLASELVKAEQNVRQRLAQLLHDDLQQLLYAAEVQLEFLRRDEDSAPGLQDMTHIIREAINTTRQLTLELSPPLLRGEGLPEALDWLAQHMAQTYQLHVRITGHKEDGLANEHFNTLLYQITRELLFNVVKHANVKEAEVDYNVDANGATVTVRDHGLGFDMADLPAAESTGFGLRSVNERLQLFGGHADIYSRPGEGTQVTLFLPHRPEQGTAIMEN